MRNTRAPAPIRNDPEQPLRTSDGSSESPCIVCVEQRTCSEKSQANRDKKHEFTARTLRAA